MVVPIYPRCNDYLLNVHQTQAHGILRRYSHVILRTPIPKSLGSSELITRLALFLNGYIKQGLRELIHNTMKTAVTVFVLTLTTGIVLGTRPTKDEREAILKYHNKVRTDVNPSAANMQFLVGQHLPKVFQERFQV